MRAILVVVGQVIFLILRVFCFVLLLRYRMAGITESAMVAYTHKYAVV